MKHWTGIFMSLFFITALNADPLTYTISAESSEEAPLIQFPAEPVIPTPDELAFSLDGGQSALELEVSPLEIKDGVRHFDPSLATSPGLPIISKAPFLSQMLPHNFIELSKFNRIIPEPLKNEKPDFSNVNWEFKIIDENNLVVHRERGMGSPPPHFTWDGTENGVFVMDPNRTYSPMIVLTTTGMPPQTWPGEAARFLAVAHAETNQTHFYFSERIYEKGLPEFSKEAQLVLLELRRRISEHVGLYARNAPKEWSLELTEPEGSPLGQERKMTWIKFLEASLGQPLPDDIVSLHYQGKEPSAQFTLEGEPTYYDPIMLGVVQEPNSPQNHASNWIQIKETKDALTVEMAHNRLFYPGTAYLREEALPSLQTALDRVKKERVRGTEWTLLNNWEEARMQQEKGRKLILRSLSGSMNNQKFQKKEDDPKLVALRTKVLFNLMARERFLSDSAPLE